MEVINGQALDHVADGLDDLRGLADLNDGINDVFVVIPLVTAVVANVKKFVNDLPVSSRKGGADLVTGVFHGYKPADVDKTVQGNAVPFLHVFVFICHQGQFRGRIIDEGGKIVPVPLGERVFKELIQLVLDFTGTGIQDVQKRLVFSVNIRNKMLGSLGQIQNRPEVNDLRAGGLDGGILLGE